jgi:membrane fusion protein, multidrug efflux system
MRHTAPLFLLLVAAAGCSPPPAQARPAPDAAPIKVASAPLALTPVPRRLMLTGTLKANAESAVAANASGQVVRTHVERGSVVRKGAPLVTLDARATGLARTDSQAALDGARAQRAQADSECARTRRLFEKRLVSQQELDQANARCKVEAEAVAAAEARLAQASISVGDATVRAPFDGIVTERAVDVGEYVRPESAIATVVAVDPLRIELTIGETDAGLIAVGQSLTFQVKAVPGRIFTGTVRYVAPALRAATRDLVFEAVVPNADGALKAGTFATAWLETGTEERVVVPAAALCRDGDTLRAFVVTGGRVEERVVQRERELGDRAVIAVGLAAGDRLITTCSADLRDGAPVVE